MVLHKWKSLTKQGWFWVSKESRYPYAHITRSMTYYTSSFDLSHYIHHAIGSGAYSLQTENIRNNKPDRIVDEELKFSEKQKFNDMIEFRFPGATEELMKDSRCSGECQR